MLKRPQTMHHKVSSAFIAFFTIFALCFVFLIQYSYRKQLTAQHLQQYQYENALAATRMSDILETTQSRCNNIIVTINNLIDFSDTEMQLVTRLYKMRSIFTNNLISEENIAGTMIVFSQGEVHKKDSVNFYSYSPDGMALLQYLQKMNIDNTGCYFYPDATDYDIIPKGIYYAKKLTEIDTLYASGYVVLRLDEAQLFNVYAEQASSSNLTYYFLDPAQNLVSTDDPAIDLSTTPKAESNLYLAQLLASQQEKGCLVQSTDLSHGWTLISVYNLKADLAADLDNLYVLFAIGGVVLLLLYFAMIRVSKHLTDPLAALAEHMTDLTPALPRQITNQSDLIEVESLTNSFNIMVSHYHELFHKMQAEQEAKRLLEMQLLQTQIKPHFLYNTLGSAHCLNATGNAAQADGLIKSLVSYYRIVLSNGADWIPLAKEFEATERYLEIMAVRYASFLSYEIDLPTELAQYTIPKLTIQPLVENAIEHGIKPLRQKSKLSVFAELEGDFILIHVRDYGAGMPTETFESYLHGDKPSREDGGFGLKNVADRVDNYYKGRGSILLNPVSSGTDLVVRIPKQ